MSSPGKKSSFVASKMSAASNFTTLYLTSATRQELPKAAKGWRRGSLKVAPPDVHGAEASVAGPESLAHIGRSKVRRLEVSHAAAGGAEEGRTVVEPVPRRRVGWPHGAIAGERGRGGTGP